jgi:phosphoribosylaminoimidazolecarboxamide formyltransferase/IMP cyclohydrolase
LRRKVFSLYPSAPAPCNSKSDVATPPQKAIIIIFENSKRRLDMSLNSVTRIDERVSVRNVLISVSNKAWLGTLVPGLLASCPNVRIFSTGGTYIAILQLLGAELAKHHLVSVSDYTGQPEMQGGLVKTLDFKIYLGLLSETYNDAHRHDLDRTQSVAIDMVVVNLYPFAQTVAKPDVTPESARTNSDIGGPCMIRASAKNYLRVASVTDPLDYPPLLAELQSNGGGVGLDTRFALMKKAFAHTAAYDTAIAAFFANTPPKRIHETYQVNS